MQGILMCLWRRMLFPLATHYEFLQRPLLEILQKDGHVCKIFFSQEARSIFENLCIFISVDVQPNHATGSLFVSCARVGDGSCIGQAISWVSINLAIILDKVTCQNSPKNPETEFSTSSSCPPNGIRNLNL